MAEVHAAGPQALRRSRQQQHSARYQQKGIRRDRWEKLLWPW